ncbi:gliding motility-associated ABC transporter substrate-binding protein GldG [Ornithobacterium rhinotracheale]|uniref:Gliding motility-associated ABC transporter substrate-binding protein GldG n=1 Tax=Ornithobacterium rhinotracheale TaxID=28251 RepID=A0A3R5XTX8_ORNRH|nr:gliding motility-associated ABC transporter substrate-binding protein GldG [Ornithobacterium rhinotracheale]QAR31065.1 gliding motility-associated ABC transporter substrate-binding protein GldG [Ornithobacterium rhinotracheale]
MKKINLSLVLIVGFLIIIFLSQIFYKRWDFTEDKRYSFAPSTEQVLKNIKNPIKIHIFLDGDLTASFKTLKSETQFFLNEIQRANKNIEFKFINPTAENLNLDSLKQLEVQDIAVPTNDKILRVFPFATIDTEGKSATISLLSNQKIPIEQRALASTDQIENKFIKELYRLTQKQRKKVGLIVHHDELFRQYMEGFASAAMPDYDIEPYTEPLTNGSQILTVKDLENLEKFDVLLIAKPLKPFSDSDKLVIDQYIMRGGKTLWLTEAVDAEMDSLFRKDKIVAFPRDPNIKDLLFNYGVRIMPAVVKDLQSAYITLAIGEADGNTAYEQFPWAYFPLSMPMKNSPITKKINNPLRFEFANPVEILPRDSVRAEVLLASSPNVQLQSPLTYIDFGEINQTTPQNYPTQQGVYPLAVLLEGNFKSAYAGRYEAREVQGFKPNVRDNKMIIIGDGDFAKNHLFRGMPLPLGADKYSMRPDMPAAPAVIYDNAAFLVNCIDYLVGDETILNLNNKQRSLFLLDKNKIKVEKSLWRWYTIAFPALIVGLMCLLLPYWRKRRFTKHT